MKFKLKNTEKNIIYIYYFILCISIELITALGVSAVSFGLDCANNIDEISSGLKLY